VVYKESMSEAAHETDGQAEPSLRLVPPVVRDGIGRICIIFPEPTAGLYPEWFFEDGVIPELEQPATENAALEPVVFPELEASEVRRMLSKKDKRTPNERVEELLRYALHEPYDNITVAIPVDLVEFRPENLSVWVSQNMQKMLRMAQFDRVKLDELYEDTDKYNLVPWLQRSIKISEMMGLNPEALAVQIATRLILRDAERARKNIQKS